MSQIAKVLLVATSLAPALGAFALNEWQEGDGRMAIGLIVAAVLLAGICWLVRLFPARYGERQRLDVTAVESTDKEALSFMIAYLFPILTRQFPDLSKEEYWALTIYVFGVVGLTVYHSNAFHFNPLLACMGYHFYQVTADEGMKYLVITNRIIRKQRPDITVTPLSDYVYLEVSSDGTEAAGKDHDS